MRSILVVPRVASGPRRDRLPCQGVTEMRMNAGRKDPPLSPLLFKKIPDRPATPVHKDAALQTDSSEKSGKPEHKAGFAPGTYYRQGVLVPGGPHKGPMPRSKSR
jgi:hypothetical protein